MTDKELIEEAQRYIKACRSGDFAIDADGDLNTEGDVQDKDCQDIVLSVNARNISPKEAKKFVRKWALRR